MGPMFRPGFPPRIKTDKEMRRPDRRLRLTQSITCCAECEEPIEYKSAGDETWRWCENCQLVEGDTFTIEDDDDCDCSMGEDGATPSRCRKCRVRGRW